MSQIETDFEDGVYFRDGTVYKVQHAVHGSGRPYAKRLVVGSDNRGVFEYAPGAIRDLTPAMKMTLDQARQFGALYGVCANCAAPLTDEVSIARGIGPVCEKRIAAQAPTYEAPDPESVELQQAVEAEVAAIVDERSNGQKRQPKPKPAPVVETGVPPAGHDEKPAADVVGGAIRVDQERNVAQVGFDFHLTGFSRALVDEIKAIPGRSYDPETKRWTVPVNASSARALLALAESGRLTVDGADVLSYLATKAERNLALSQALDAEIPPIPGFGRPGLELRPFQRVGVKYLTVNRRAILADEQGLGKTPESLGAATLLDAFPILVACPDVAWTNWGREATRWLPGKRVVLLSGQRKKMVGTLEPWDGRFAGDRVIDDRHVRSVPLGGLLDYESEIREADIVIVASSNLSAWTAVPVKRERMSDAVLTRERDKKGFVLNDVPFKAKILDEAQEYKEAQAARSRAAKTLARYDGADRCYDHDGHCVWPTTGTPIMNRTEELLSPLEMVDRLDEFGGWYGFLRTASTPEGQLDLHRKLRENCMVRRVKADVLPDLPRAQRQTVPVPFDRAHYDDVERDLLQFIRERIAADAEFEASIAHLDEATRKAARRERMFSKASALYGPAAAIVRINYLKQAAALDAVEGFCGWIDAFLEQTTDPATGYGKKLLVYIEHKAIASAIAERYGADRIVGGLGAKRRVEAEDRFQSDPAARVLVLSYLSASTALTLTAASDNVWLELPWRPTDIDQGEGRCYGRINDPHGANTYYLVPDGTIYEDIAELLDQKAAVIARTTDGKANAEKVSILNDLLKRLEARATGQDAPDVSDDLTEADLTAALIPEQEDA